MFNAGSAPPPSADGAALSVGGETIVRGKSAGDEIVVTVSASTVTGQTAGAEFDIVSDKVEVGSFNGDFSKISGDNLSVKLVGVPTTLTDGVYGTITLTVKAGVTADMPFSIGVSDFMAYNADGTKTPVDAGAPLMVNKAMPTLTPDKTGDVMIPRDGEATVTVTAAGFDGTITFSDNATASDDGMSATVTASEAGNVTVTAEDDIDPEMAKADISFILTPQVASSVSEAVTVLPGGSGMATVTLMDAVDAEFAFKVEGEGVESEDDGSTVTLTASGTATATVSATVKVNGEDFKTNEVSVAFELGVLTLASDADEAVTVLPGGMGTVTLTASGQAEGADVEFSSDDEGVTVTENEDGMSAAVTASGTASATVTASVGGAEASVDVAFELGALTLASDADEAVTVLPGGMGTVTLTASGQAEGADVEFSSDDEGVTVTENEDGMSAAVTASGTASATVTASVGGAEASVDVAFELGALTLASDADEAVTVLPGGMGTVTLTASGQAEGADVEFSSDDEGVTVTENEDGMSAAVTASGTASATVTASVGGAEASVDVAFEQSPLTLTADMTEVIIPYAGAGTATLTASGQAEGAEVAFTVDGDGVTHEADGATIMLTASDPATATVMASVGGVESNAVEVAFVDAPPEVRTDNTEVEVPRGGEAMVEVMSVGFPEGANITYTTIAFPGVTATEEGGILTITTGATGSVTVTATDGTMTTPVPLTISFVEPPPELMASAMDAVIPAGGTATVDITAVGFDTGVSYTINKQSGTATLTQLIIDNKTVQLAASGGGGAVVTVSATDGTNSTAPITITFWAMPTASADADMVMVPSSTIPSASATVTASGFPDPSKVSFTIKMISGVEGSVTGEEDGAVLTLTSTGAAVVEVTASDGTTTLDPVTVTFTQDLPAAPSSLAVQDQPSDNGYYVMISFTNSEDHMSVSQYRVYREMPANTVNEDDVVVPTDNPDMVWVPWAVIDAVSSDDNTTRAVVPVTDGMATRWGVSAEKGQHSGEEVITPSGKRVFSKESVQLLVQILGVDPNLIVSQDELAQMFMPSAEYIQSLIGDRKNVVFAALDPDVSVLMGGDVNIPQNIRTDGVGPIVSSPMVMTEDAVAAVDNTAPAAVTDVTGDAETGIVTWTLSADEGIAGAIDYRGFSIPILGVRGYKIMGGVSEDAMIDIGVVPAGTGTFQVPAELLQSMIDRGVPAVMVVVVALDGTNMTPSTPLVVLLEPVRKAFVDADGSPVYIVKLDNATTPLTVDFEDFVAFTMAFNTSEATSTREEWRIFIQSDLNDDGMVDFDDFILFFGSYGKEAAGRAGKSLIPSLGVNENAEFSLHLGSDRVVVGETMFVDVSLANVQALMGYGFVLNYDAEKFEFVEAMPAAEDLLMSSGGETPLLKGWSPEAGQVHVMNGIVNGSEVSGDGDIVRLVFRVLRDFEDNARFEIAEGLVFDPSQLANPLAGGVLDIQTTPTEFALLQNFPNPFNPETTIGYELAESADVTLQIYNVVGQVVRTLMAAEPQSVGRYQVRWDGMDDRGTPVSSGIYFYQISAGKFQDVRKLMLLK